MVEWSTTRLSAITLFVLVCLPCLVHVQAEYSPEVVFLLTTRHTFWTRGNILSYKLHLFNYTQINISRVITPTSIDYDNTTKLMYWTDISTEQVRAADTNGLKNITVASLNNISYPEGIALDAGDGKLFYTDRGNKVVVRIALSGYASTVIVKNDTGAPWGIVADTKNKMLYWVDHNNDTVESSDYDGNGRKILTNDTYAPTGIALNEKSGRLYWCEYNGQVKYMSTSGMEAPIFISGGKEFGTLMDIALYNGFLYVTDRRNARIVVIPESDGEPMFIRLRGITNINGIHVFSPNSMETGCTDGMYGVGCAKPCGKCKQDTSCEKTTGVCIGGCDIGYTGTMCTDVCKEGTYGVGCFYRCGNCRSGTTCNHITGDCPSGCESPWTGLHCRDRDVGPELVLFLTQRHSYFTNGRIFKLALHHMNFTTLTSYNVITPTSIDYDTVKKRVYWTDISTEEVRSVDIHGHHDELVAKLNNISYPEGIVVDGAAGKVFYSDRGNKVIVRIDINGYANTTIVSTGLDSPWGLTADKTNRQLYWVDHSTDIIATCDYDGNNRRNITNTTTAVFAPTGIAINEKTGRIYWCQYNGAVYSILKDGTDKKTLIRVRIPIRRFMDISLFNGLLYVTDRTNGRVTVIPENGGTEMRLSSSFFVRLNGIHVVSPTTQETGCDDGKYGVGCTNMCGHCTVDTTCEKTVGVCLARCAPGYTGELCTDTCTAGRYGKRCNSTCSVNCKTTCNHVTGDCEGGCSTGFTGSKCEHIVCSPGTYGQAVCLKCGQCSDGGACDSITGNCPFGCKTGWRGDKCQTMCYQGTYGDSCKMSCGACAGGMACDRIDGTCPNGCLNNWSGSKCDTKQACPQGSYGDRCVACGNCKAGTHCFSINGHCPEGCQKNWVGPKCDVRATVCHPGTYGPNCYSSCGKCKNNETCLGTTGACPSGCKPGWSGPVCKVGCQPNYYGEGCNNTCGYCKTATTCDPETGVCHAGCISGWEGSKCHAEKGAKPTQAAGIVRTRYLDLLGIGVLLIIFNSI